MNITNVIGTMVAVLLLASFIPDIITEFNTAENTTGADASLSTGFDIAQIVLGLAAGLIVLRMVGFNITGRGRR